MLRTPRTFQLERLLTALKQGPRGVYILQIPPPQGIFQKVFDFLPQASFFLLRDSKISVKVGEFFQTC